MKKRKWAKGLNKETIAKIKELTPDAVECVHSEPQYTAFIIRVGAVAGAGVAICSPVDARGTLYGDGFNHNKGKNKAAGRALKALVNGQNDLPIRFEVPPNWYPSQQKQIKEMHGKFAFKSLFLDNPSSDIDKLLNV